MPGIYNKISQFTALLLLSSAALAADNDFYNHVYQPVPSVSGELAQIVFYRDANPSSDAAHVYVDRSFQTALLPGQYTVFCLKAGRHTLESWINDAPLYLGKANPQVETTLEGGKTYFVRTPEQEGNGTPESVHRRDAEQLLPSFQLQARFVSRVAGIQPCQGQTEQMQQAPTAQGGGFLRKAVEENKVAAEADNGLPQPELQTVAPVPVQEEAAPVPAPTTVSQILPSQEAVRQELEQKIDDPHQVFE